MRTPLDVLETALKEERDAHRDAIDGASGGESCSTEKTRSMETSLSMDELEAERDAWREAAGWTSEGFGPRTPAEVAVFRKAERKVEGEAAAWKIGALRRALRRKVEMPVKMTPLEDFDALLTRFDRLELKVRRQVQLLQYGVHGLAVGLVMAFYLLYRSVP